MIQRIQTLWLFLALASSVIMFFFPVANLFSETQEFIFFLIGIYAANDCSLYATTYSLIGLTGLTGLLSFITIFLYKKRVTQMRLCVYTSILMLAIIGIEAYYIFYLFKGHEFLINYIAFMPLIGFILLLMARRAIKKDEELIKSIDRIR